MPYQYCVSHVRLKSKVSNAGSFTLVLALRIAVVCRRANRIAGSQLCLVNSQEVSKCFRALGCKVRRLKSTCVALQEKSASWLLQAQANLVAFHVLLSVSSLGGERVSLLCVDGMAAVRVCVALQLFLHMSSVASRFTVLAGLQVQANLVAFRVLPTLQNWVSVLSSREGRVVSLFCARSPGFWLRLNFQATVSVRESQRGFLALAFSTRTLKRSGVSARRAQGGGFCASMLALVCSTPACPELLVVVRFRWVHCCSFPKIVPAKVTCLFDRHVCCIWHM